jgi:hypothetical protein
VSDQLRGATDNGRDAQLDGDQPQYASAMAPLAMKSRHFAPYSVTRGRDKEGKARRTKVESSCR